jgi:putative sigma-54 modulation protein
MKLTAHSKNYTISDKLTNIINKKLEKIEKYFDEGATCTISCSRIGKTEKMGVVINQKGNLFRAEAVSSNMYANIDIALSKIERQIIKNKERLRSVLRKESLDDRKFAFYTKAPAFLQTEIMRRKSFAIKSMSAEDAELALDTSDHAFWVYAGEGNKINIMYRRADGHVGIIEIANSKAVDL